MPMMLMLSLDERDQIDGRCTTWRRWRPWGIWTPICKVKVKPREQWSLADRLEEQRCTGCGSGSVPSSVLARKKRQRRHGQY